tara:strand:+ start:1698 stop:2282 length:585 start_codon:yes stop_codon:yes gene_type:complete
MATSTSPLSRQPTKLDYSSPTQFKFSINQLPKVEFFTVAANLPGISLPPASYNTPFKNIPTIGEKPEYEDLTITFIVDEFLENYISIHEWITGTGFPKSRQQFSDFRTLTANNPTDAKTVSVDKVGTATPDRGMYGDATLTILSNKNNPLVEIRFQDLFPTSLGGLDYTQVATDVEYLNVQVTFQYKIYEIVTL